MRPVNIKGIEFQAEGTTSANALSLKHIYVIGLENQECAGRVISKRENQRRNGLAVPLGQGHQTFCMFFRPL